MVLIVPVNVWQIVSFRKIQIDSLFKNHIAATKAENYKATYSIGSKTNHGIKIWEKEGKQKESKKKEFFGCGKSKD